MDAAQKTNRDRGNGRYAPTLERVCRCGHTLGRHTAERSHGAQPCISGDFTGTVCPCQAFKAVRR